MSMIRRHENPLALRAGLLSVLVHCVLLMVLLLSFNWKSIPSVSVAEVELWDKLPVPANVIKRAPAHPVKLKPVVKEPEPEAEPAPKAEIQLKKKPLKQAEVKPEKKVEKKLEKPLSKPEPDPALEIKEAKEKMRKLQQKLAEEDQQDARQAQKSAAQAAKIEQANAANQAANKIVMEGYAEKIRNKIRQFVNPQLCGSGKPEMELAVTLIPTGEVIGSPRITKSSGISACDESVERAVLQASPLPVPKESELFNALRNLKLRFRPLD